MRYTKVSPLVCTFIRTLLTYTHVALSDQEKLKLKAGIMQAIVDTFGPLD